MSQIPLSADVESLVDRMFPDRPEETRQLLLTYADNEANRVRRGLLVLSQGRFDLLTHYVACALRDYRDILYWAEYPDD